MMTPRREIELVSPLYFPDVTRLCRISKNGLVAECFSCGTVMHGGVHLCEVAYGGFFCANCCPACTGIVKLTPVEVEAMERNKAHPPALKVSRCSKTVQHERQQHGRLPIDAPIHILDEDRVFRGKRLQCWQLLHDGMTVRAFIEACKLHGLDARHNLCRFVRVYGCVKVPGYHTATPDE